MRNQCKLLDAPIYAHNLPMRPAWRKLLPLKKQPTNLSLSPDVRDAGRALAEKKGYSLSDYVENLLLEEIEIDRLEGQGGDQMLVAHFISKLREHPLSDRFSVEMLGLDGLKVSKNTLPKSK